jgi:hypothetical protein
LSKLSVMSRSIQPTASGAQNIGGFGALGVGGYIALAGLLGSPILRAFFTKANRPEQD